MGKGLISGHGWETHNHSTDNYDKHSSSTRHLSGYVEQSRRNETKKYKKI